MTVTQSNGQLNIWKGGYNLNDETFVYRSDIRERKQAAAGARNKKNGSKSKRCTLPSDSLSKAKLEKMNGPVETTAMNVPRTYEQLSQLDPSLQFLYLDHLVNEYHARRVDLMAMLGVSPSTISKILQRLPGRLRFSGRPKEPAQEWLSFIGQPAAPAAPALSGGSIIVTSTAEAAFGFLMRMVDPEGLYDFEIKFKTKEGVL